MDETNFIELVVRPTLDFLDPDIPYSETAVNLITFTCLVESDFNYIKQVGGPALGFVQMEPATELDIWQNYLSFRPKLNDKIKSLVLNRVSRETNLAANLIYQVAICRVHYYRVPEKLPGITSAEQMAAYYKKYYNTFSGKSTIERAKKVYSDFLARRA